MPLDLLNKKIRNTKTNPKGKNTNTNGIILDLSIFFAAIKCTNPEGKPTLIHKLIKATKPTYKESSA